MVVCITLLFALWGVTSFADTSCEAYKQQVLNDCTAMQTTIDTLKGRSGDIWKIQQAAMSWNSHNQNIGDNLYREYYNTIVSYCESASDKITVLESQLSSIRSTAQSLVCTSSDGSCNCAEVLGNISSQLSTINDSLVAQGAKFDTIITRLNSIITITTTIRDKVSNVDTNVGDMSTVLTDIKGYLESQSDVLQSILGDNYDQGIKGILANVEATSEWFDDIYGLLQKFEQPIADTAAQLNQICDYFDNYLQQAFPLWLELLQKLDPDKVESALDNLSNNLGLGNFLNIFTNNNFATFMTSSGRLSIPGQVIGNRWIDFYYTTDGKLASRFSYTYPDGSLFVPSWLNFIKLYGSTIPMALTSLNNYEYLSWLDRKTNDVNSILRDFTNQVAVGFSSITNTLVEQFSIFANDSPLKGTTEKPDKYYDYLTNYYINVSVNPSGSASESYTNWFNRMEMLLAALVFKTDKPVSNDFNTASAESMEGSLSGALDNVRGIQDNSQSVITTVEKSSRSLLNVMSQWDDKLTMAASLPSHIEFVDLGGAKDGGGAKRASDSPSGVDTKIGIDLSSGPLKLFVDSCRSITTLCWIFVFIFAGWGVARFMVSKFLTIIKLCYVIFKTALGLG